MPIGDTIVVDKYDKQCYLFKCALGLHVPYQYNRSINFIGGMPEHARHHVKTCACGKRSAGHVRVTFLSGDTRFITADSIQIQDAAVLQLVPSKKYTHDAYIWHIDAKGRLLQAVPLIPKFGHLSIRYVWRDYEVIAKILYDTFDSKPDIYYRRSYAVDRKAFVWSHGIPPANWEFNALLNPDTIRLLPIQDNKIFT